MNEMAASIAMSESNQTPPQINPYQKEIEYYDRLHSEKYRDKHQNFLDHCEQLARNLATNRAHFEALYESLVTRRFLPAGRLQAALGATEREVSPFNCSVSQTINDSIDSIFEGVWKAAKILRLGTGIGFNFSHLRPDKDIIKKLDTEASGPLSFMSVFDAMATTISSSGHRRGAMMGIMNVTHPDIEKFIDAKMVKGAFRQFNLSVGVTDKFMECVKANGDWAYTFEGKEYGTVKARYLWEKIVKNAYYSAEPGIIFIDRLNQSNNLWYCENIEATNPCAEQPLPPNGLCLLGSFNQIAYVEWNHTRYRFNVELLKKDIRNWVEAYDNIFDEAIYAVPEHREEAISKRRMGLGYTSIANAIELLCGKANYGEPEFCEILDSLCRILTHTAYEASAMLAKDRKPFALFDKEKYLKGEFTQTLPLHIKDLISAYGIRNSHLISYAPCGTISQCAWNVSSGVEPIFYHSVDRDVHMKGGKEKVTLNDFNVRTFGFKGKTLEECTTQDHMSVSRIIQKYTDSAVSKTVNVPEKCSYADYEKIYLDAYDNGLKGITVFRPTELRGAVITKAKDQKEIDKFASCSITGECPVQ